MCSIFVGVHIKNKPSDIVPVKNLEFDKDVGYLKREIAKEIKLQSFDIYYMGNILEEDMQLSEVLSPNSTVHCFERFAAQKVHNTDKASICAAAAQELFSVIAHVQISVNSRINILQKILTEYPEFRRNLGAQAFIRDSVLSNTLSQPEVTENIAKHYPLICEAAPFIVDTVKKELTTFSASTNFSEPATDSTNSSEEENSMGATRSTATNEGASGSRSEYSHIRFISRQQLQAALAQIGAGSHNSLSNIAQRNVDSDGGAAPVSTSRSVSVPAVGERITTDFFQSELQRALNAWQNQETVPSTAARDLEESMDTSETPANDDAMNVTDASDVGGNEMPQRYRNHPYVEQLRTMAQMGFKNYEENLIYLNLTNGNIENAINLLVGALT